MAGVVTDAGAGMVALSCHGVSKVFPASDMGFSWRVALGYVEPSSGIQALGGVSLQVPKGKISGILGRNGAGKSTLLRTLGGVYTPNTGSINIEGVPSGLFELGGLGNPHLTGREYTKRSLILQGASRRAINKLTVEVQDFSELGIAFEDKILTYSSGMAARLFFACATALQHQVYLIDELLAVGDESFQAKCWGRMRERLAHGASGLLVTHDWSAVIKLCENSYILDDGRIVDSGPSDEVIARYLGLEKPAAASARLLVDDASPLKQLEGCSGEDMTFSVPVQIRHETEVALGMSIEMLRIGIGWEIALLHRNIPVGPEPNDYDVKIRIPKLPLSAGDYALGLFLTDYQPNIDKPPSTIHDVRSWTYGNGLHLKVHGDSSDALSQFDLEWRLHG